MSDRRRAFINALEAVMSEYVDVAGPVGRIRYAGLPQGEFVAYLDEGVGMSDNRTKAQIVADAETLDQRRQEQLARQIDSINRLLGVQELSPAFRYEAEMKALNDSLAGLHIENERLVAIINKVRKSTMDRSAATTNDRERAYLERLLDMMTEGASTSYDGRHGRTPESDRPADVADQPRTPEQLAD